MSRGLFSTFLTIMCLMLLTTLAAENACGEDAVSYTLVITDQAPYGTFSSNSPVVLGQPMVFTATAGGTPPLTSVGISATGWGPDTNATRATPIARRGTTWSS